MIDSFKIFQSKIGESQKHVVFLVDKLKSDESQFEVDHVTDSGLSESKYVFLRRKAGPFSASKSGRAMYFRVNNAPANPFGVDLLKIRISGHANRGTIHAPPHYNWSIDNPPESEYDRFSAWCDLLSHIETKFPKGDKS